MGRAAISLALLTTLAVGAGVASAHMIPSAVANAFPGRNGVIVFERRPPNGTIELHTVDLRGRVTHLTRSGRAANPVWAPDGRRIAADFYDPPVVLTTTPAVIPARLHDSSWAPGGRRIVGSDPANEGGGDIAILDLRTGTKRFLHVDTGIATAEMDEPDWAPDGRLIAIGWNHGGWARIMLYDVHTQRMRASKVSSPDYAAESPAWSPNSKRLAFDTGYNARSAIYVARAADGKQRQLLARNAFSPAWSPDGRKIAFVRQVSPWNSEIFVMNADGTGQRRLTHNPWQDLHPDWQRLP
jgi:TolB protein